MKARLILAFPLLTALVAGSAQAEPIRIMVTEAGDSSVTGTAEFRGLEADGFDSHAWEENRLHWVPDRRSPMLEPREGACRNIYAPSAVETTGGWHLFYGGWDGVPTGNDRIYRRITKDFLSFGDAQTVIEHGSFQHVCNVSAMGVGEGGFELACTAFPDLSGCNKPALFRSADGETWNGSPAPYQAAQEDIVGMTGYASYPGADINGMNVILREGEKLRLYFGNFRDFGRVYRATSTGGTTFSLEGPVLQEPLAVNDVKKFRTGDSDCYLMGLHMNRGELRYSLSRDGLKFAPSQKLFDHLGDEDRFMVAIGWVVKGEQEKPGRRLLGVLYGAGAAPTLDRNRIFARWLQKRIVATDAEGRELEPNRAWGPDRQLLTLPDGKPGTVRVRLYRPDGLTLAGESGPIELRPGHAYQVATEF